MFHSEDSALKFINFIGFMVMVILIITILMIKNNEHPFLKSKLYLFLINRASLCFLADPSNSLKSKSLVSPFHFHIQVTDFKMIPSFILMHPLKHSRVRLKRTKIAF